MKESHGYRDEDMVPVGTAAVFVGVHVTTLRRWADNGRLTVYRTPTNQRRFRVGDLRALLAAERPSGSAA